MAHGRELKSQMYGVPMFNVKHFLLYSFANPWLIPILVPPILGDQPMLYLALTTAAQSSSSSPTSRVATGQQLLVKTLTMEGRLVGITLVLILGVRRR